MYADFNQERIGGFVEYLHTMSCVRPLFDLRMFKPTCLPNVRWSQSTAEFIIPLK